MLNYLVAIILGIGSFYALAYVVGLIREGIMLSNLAARLPQTPDEWEAEREADWQFLTRMIEDADEETKG